MPKEHIIFLDIDEMLSLQILAKMFIEANGKIPAIVEKYPLSPMFIEQLTNVERKLSEKIGEVSD